MWPPVGKVRPLDVAAQLHARQLLVVEQLDERGTHLPKVMRRDVGGHTHGDAGRAVDQQIRDACGQDDGLGARAVVIGTIRDRIAIEFLQHLVGDACQPALGIAHGRRRIAVERPEVAGSIDERHAQGKRLRHANQRFVNGGIAVRMVVAHDVTDDLGALAVLRVSRQVLLPHRVKNAALHRLEPIADIRQGARGDHRQRVVQVPGLRGFVQRDHVAVLRSAATGRRGGRRRAAAAWRCGVVEIEEGRFGRAFGHGVQKYNTKVTKNYSPSCPS